MVRLSALAAFCFAAATQVAAQAAQRVVVVTDPALVLDSYSAFWASLTDRGYELVFRSSTAAEPTLAEHDVLSFDHLVLFAPTSKSFPADLSPQSLFSYVARARNLLVVVSPDLSEYWRDLAREFDVEFDDRGNRVIDHFAYDTGLDDGTHSTLVVPLGATASPFVSAATRAGPPVLYRGAGHEVGKQPLLSSILRAGPTAYSYDVKDDALTEDAFVSGTSVGLVSAMQARNNARVTFAGSLDLFSDAFASAPVQSADGSSFPASGNTAFIKDLTSWTFQETGILRVSSASLSRAIDGKSLPLYRVRDELDYSIEVSTLSAGSWVPFPASDFQFEFTMLDPHLRLPLTVRPSPAASTSALLGARFRAPDRHGVFTLRVDYRRPGWTYLDEKLVVSVTPPRHDEYDRFIVGAWPYYAGAFSVSAATLVFAVLWALQ